MAVNELCNCVTLSIITTVYGDFVASWEELMRIVADSVFISSRGSCCVSVG